MATGDYPVRDGDGTIIQTGNNGGSEAAAALEVPMYTKAKSLVQGQIAVTEVATEFSLNVEGYTAGQLQFAATAFTGTLVVEQSDNSTDGIDGTWVACALVPVASVGASPDVTSVTAAGIWNFSVLSCWVRVRCSAFTSATAAFVSAIFEQGSVVPPRSVHATIPALLAGTSLIGAASVGASSTVGTACINARVKSAASVNNTLVLAGVRKLFGFVLHNTSAAKKYVKFYNKATAPVAGTDTPVFTVEIQPNSSAFYNNAIGKAFSLGLCYAITNLLADNDATAVAIDDVTGHLDYI